MVETSQARPTDLRGQLSWTAPRGQVLSPHGMSTSVRFPVAGEPRDVLRYGAHLAVIAVLHTVAEDEALNAFALTFEGRIPTNRPTKSTYTISSTLPNSVAMARWRYGEK